MSDLHDRELAATLDAERERRRRQGSGAEPAPTGSPIGGEQAADGRESAPVDRSSPRWARIRAALCEHHGLGLLESLDEYADRVVAVIQNTNGRAGSTLDGLSADAAEGGKA